MDAIRIAGAAMILAVATGCAAKPENIQATYVSPYQYQHFTCAQMVEESSRVQAALTQASAKQRKVRGGDAAGIIFLGLPVSSMTGNDVTDQIALYKGQIEAIRQEGYRKNCWAQPADAKTEAGEAEAGVTEAAAAGEPGVTATEAVAKNEAGAEATEAAAEGDAEVADSESGDN